MTAVQLLLLAKQPAPGLVKTRLCPPFTPVQAAELAAAAITDTLAVLAGCPAARRVLVRTGQLFAPAGWDTIDQRGDGLGERLHNAYRDTARRGTATLLVGMDTPQLSPAVVARTIEKLAHADAVLGPAEDGGWWGLAVRDPTLAAVLPGIPMSTGTTGIRTAAALRRAGARVAIAEPLRDVDTAEDAWAVADLAPSGRFAAAVRAWGPR